MKQLAKKGDVKSARIMAREVVHSHKQMDRLSVSKARLGSIGNQLQQQLGAQYRHLCVQSVSYSSLLWYSYGQGDRLITEVDRNYEVIECSGQAAPDQPDNARNEYGDDEGKSFFVAPFLCAPNLHLRRLASWKKW